ncbi:MAG: SpoIID/LytB domain-containing protein [Leptolyngbya sp. SIO3F4]|nr:SpoIID/LytB domain-containing protein [Leptolyngbya sp. SIO3F4]
MNAMFFAFSRYSGIVLAWLMLFSVQAQKTDRIRVGLFWENRPQALLCTVHQGSYALYADGKKLRDFSGSDVVRLTVSDGRVHVKTFQGALGTFQRVVFRETQAQAALNLKASKPAQANRTYEDDLVVSVYRGKLKVVNEASFSNYLAGVVQSEAGNGHEPEYYKVQAIISRTYALKHFRRFQAEHGFNLCDRVDSQVYKTWGYNDTIRQAVETTKDVVIVDADIQLITAVFHSNSGGQTVNSEDVWTTPRPYLRATEDTFSVCQPHYEWISTYSRQDYLGYFARRHGVDTGQVDARQQLLNYCPDARTGAFLTVNEQNIPLKYVRKDLGLNSTLFCVSQSQDSVVIAGCGFGHAVGLSQEGAMRMAEEGYTYTDILHHYYRDIHLIKLSVIDFFREDP